MSEVHIETPSEREKELLQFLSQGLSNREIALKMHISPNTVKVHLRNIFAKLNVLSRTEAVMVAIKNGWVTVEGAVTPTVVAESETEATVEPEMPPEPPAPPIVIELVNAPPQRVTWRQRLYLISTFIVVLLLFSLVRFRQPISPIIEGQPTPTAEQPTQRNVGWANIAPLLKATSGLTAIIYNSRLYAIGGEIWQQDVATVSDLVQVYDLAKQTWSEGPALPVAVADAGGVALRGRLFVLGGRLADGSVGDRLQVFDPADGQWSVGRSLPQPLSACAVTVYAGDIYLFGGWDGQQAVGAAYAYDPQQEQWTPLAAMPTPRAFLAAGTIGEHIYVVGGYDGQNELDTCEVYMPDQDRWAACPPMNRPRGGIGTALIGDRLYVIGGGLSETHLLVDNEIWTPNPTDPITGIWERIPSPVLGRWLHLGVATDEEMLYAIGGWSGRPLDMVWTSRLAYRIYLPMSTGGE